MGVSSRNAPRSRRSQAQPIRVPPLLAGRLVPRPMLGVMLRERLGIFDYPAGCGRFYGHNGSFASYLSYARVSADGRSAAVLLLNGLGPATEARGEKAIAALPCGAAAAS